MSKVTDNTNYSLFLQTVEEYYAENARDLPWRKPGINGSFDPYKVTLSEIMLQQTQVDRVVDKFNSFIEHYPNFVMLSKASFAEILELWSGLGYNRRARYLYDMAREMQYLPFPKTVQELVRFKGIGENTACAILTYIFNEKHVFVETNIRTAVLYHFFRDIEVVSDSQIREVMQEIVTLAENPREFYWALMDYGTWLKKQGIRNTAQSAHYTKQPPFKGSMRQIRGEVLRRAQQKQRIEKIRDEIDDIRFDAVIDALTCEGFIEIRNGRIFIVSS